MPFVSVDIGAVGVNYFSGFCSNPGVRCSYTCILTPYQHNFRFNTHISRLYMNNARSYRNPHSNNPQKSPNPPQKIKTKKGAPRIIPIPKTPDRQSSLSSSFTASIPSPKHRIPKSRTRAGNRHAGQDRVFFSQRVEAG